MSKNSFKILTIQLLSKGSLLLSKSCTSELQMWHSPCKLRGARKLEGTFAEFAGIIKNVPSPTTSSEKKMKKITNSLIVISKQ